MRSRAASILRVVAAVCATLALLSLGAAVVRPGGATDNVARPETLPPAPDSSPTPGAPPATLAVDPQMKKISGNMDQYVAQALKAERGCQDPTKPSCVNKLGVDVMGWHDAREIPNYWSYAQNFVLQDHMFEPTMSWSLPAHLLMVSGWSARCTVRDDPQSCTTSRDLPEYPPDFKPSYYPPNRNGDDPNYAWTDLTHLLHAHDVSWGYFIHEGSEPDCPLDTKTCSARPQNAQTPGIWNPLPYFTTVQ